MIEALGLYNYWVFAVLLAIGLYTIAVCMNRMKKLIGLAIFQSAVFLLFITMDKIEGGTAPIIVSPDADVIYSNPLPQVLILTAIVVGIATLALGLAIVVRIHEAFGSIEETETGELDRT